MPTTDSNQKHMKLDQLKPKKKTLKRKHSERSFVAQIKIVVIKEVIAKKGEKKCETKRRTWRGVKYMRGWLKY